jgi:hypothetical protein
MRLRLIASPSSNPGGRALVRLKLSRHVRSASRCPVFSEDVEDGEALYRRACAMNPKALPRNGRVRRIGPGGLMTGGRSSALHTAWRSDRSRLSGTSPCGFLFSHILNFHVETSRT